MAFSFEWQSEGFSYATATGSTKKSKKRKNAPSADTNGVADCNEDAAQLASKKLSMFSMDDSSEKSVAASPVDHENLKSSLKSSHKRKKLSVSFFENSSEYNSFESNENCKLPEKNGTCKTNSKKNNKKLKKAAKKLEKERQASSESNRMEGKGSITITSNISEKVKSQVHLKDSVSKDSNAIEPSVPTAIKSKQLNGMKLSKKQNKQLNKGNKNGSSEKLEALKPDVINTLNSQKQSSIEINGYDLEPPGNMEEEKALGSKVPKKNKDKKKSTSLSTLVSLEPNDKKLNKNLEIVKASVNKTKLVTKVVKSNSDDGSEDEWSDCEDEFSHVSDDGPEVQEFDEEAGEDKLDEAFHKDLKSLFDDLDFEGVKKQMKAEAGTREESEYSDEDEDENGVSESDASEDASNASEDASRTDGNDSEDSDECMEEENHEQEKLNKKETLVLLKHDPKKKSLPNVNTSKLSASLALFTQQQPLSSGGPAANKLTSTDTLVQKMRTKLNVAKFRMINEQLYSTTGSEALQMFKREPESFRVYHDGFKSQVALWPLNPLDVIVEWLKQQPRQLVVADFGCGEAELSERVSQRVHSLDLVATKPQVTVCDMARTPLGSQSVDVAVFCLSLMGTNVSDFVAEANRTLKLGGILKIAEVESRITNLDEFVAVIQKFGFKCNKKPINHQYFVTMDFKKFKNSKSKDVLPQIKLKPCLYKKR